MAKKGSDEVIIDLNIEGEADVIRLTKSIDELTAANKELRKERNALKPVDEESRQRIKDINAELDKNNAKVKENSSNLEKQRLNTGNYTKSIVAAYKEIRELKASTDKLILAQDKLDKSTAEGKKEFDRLTIAIQENNQQINEYNTQINTTINNTNVFGTSIGDLKNSISALINPYTLAIGAAVALTAAYAKSTAGARDMAKAADILSVSMGYLIEGFGKDANEFLGGESGGGISGAFIKFISFFDEASAAVVGAATRAREAMRQLEAEEKRALGFAKTFESVAESARRTRDDTSQPRSVRTAAANTVDQNISASGKVRINALQNEIELIKQSNSYQLESIDIKNQIADKQREIADIEEEINGKATENIMARRAIEAEALKEFEDGYKKDLDAYNKSQEERIAIRQGIIARELSDEILAAQLRNEQFKKEMEDRAKIEAAAKSGAAAVSKQIDAQARKQKEKEDKTSAQKQKDIATTTEFFKRNVEQQTFTQKTVLGKAANALYRANAIREIVIGTQQAAIAAYKTGSQAPFPVGVVLGPLLAAAAIAFGVGSAAKVSGIQFARGGRVNKTGTFDGPGARRHSEGGMNYVNPETGHKIEVEKGENFYVMNRSASSAINALSRTNVAHGGRDFGLPGVNMAATGGRINTDNAAADYEAILNAPQPIVIVTVEDINAGLSQKYDIVTKAKIL